jgi:hypothetical protein
VIEFIDESKLGYHLKSAAASNEGQKLAEYRIRQLGPGEIKEGVEGILRIALDIWHTRLENMLYIDDRKLFVDAVRCP